MNDYRCIDRARIDWMLREEGLDLPLTDSELALRLLDSELRLTALEHAVAALIAPRPEGAACR